MSTSRGALQTVRIFLMRKSRRERVISASRPAAKVMVAKVRPMTVRNIKCQP
jgi:hypothetical protein